VCVYIYIYTYIYTGFRGVLVNSEFPKLVPENKPRSMIRYLCISLKKERKYLIIQCTIQLDHDGVVKYYTYWFTTLLRQEALLSQYNGFYRQRSFEANVCSVRVCNHADDERKSFPPAVLPINFIFFTPHVTIVLNIITKLDEMY
jgi:hypothetical protein